MPKRTLQDVECAYLNHEFRARARIHQEHQTRKFVSMAQIPSPGLKAQVEYDEKGKIIRVYCPCRSTTIGEKGECDANSGDICMYLSRE
jgi:hypothetical protein